jgi:hypothetical protein
MLPMISQPESISVRGANKRAVWGKRCIFIAGGICTGRATGTWGHGMLASSSGTDPRVAFSNRLGTVRGAQRLTEERSSDPSSVGARSTGLPHLAARAVAMAPRCLVAALCSQRCVRSAVFEQDCAAKGELSEPARAPGDVGAVRGDGF